MCITSIIPAITKPITMKEIHFTTNPTAPLSKEVPSKILNGFNMNSEANPNVQTIRILSFLFSFNSKR